MLPLGQRRHLFYFVGAVRPEVPWYRCVRYSMPSPGCLSPDCVILAHSRSGLLMHAAAARGRRWCGCTRTHPILSSTRPATTTSRRRFGIRCSAWRPAGGIFCITKQGNKSEGSSPSAWLAKPVAQPPMGLWCCWDEPLPQLGRPSSLHMHHLASAFLALATGLRKMCTCIHDMIINSDAGWAGASGWCRRRPPAVSQSSFRVRTTGMVVSCHILLEDPFSH